MSGFYNFFFRFRVAKAIKNYSASSLIYGECYTLVPQIPVDNVGKLFGYTINVTYDKQHFMEEPIDDYKLFGWHIFIHETVHKFDGKIYDVTFIREYPVFLIFFLQWMALKAPF